MTPRDPIETRLIVVSEMLDRAIKEVRRVLDEMNAEPPAPQGGGQMEDN